MGHCQHVPLVLFSTLLSMISCTLFEDVYKIHNAINIDFIGAPPNIIQYNNTLTCADRLIVSRLNCWGSSFCKTPCATDVFPVPTGPTSSTGRSTMIR